MWSFWDQGFSFQGSLPHVQPSVISSLTPSLTAITNARKQKTRETEKAFLNWRFAELELVFQESPHAITPLLLQSGKFSSGSPAPPSQPLGLSYAEDAAEHENMKAVLKTSSPAVEDATPALGVRTRSRASRGNAVFRGARSVGSPHRVQVAVCLSGRWTVHSPGLSIRTSSHLASLSPL